MAVLYNVCSLFRGGGKRVHLQVVEGLQLVKVWSLTPGLCRERPVIRPVVEGNGLDENNYFQYYSDRQIFLSTTALGSTQPSSSGHMTTWCRPQVTTCFHLWSIRGVADKSLARPGRKQATATKLGIYSAYSPRSSVHFLAHCSNSCKQLKKIQKVVRPTRSPRRQWPYRTKNGYLSIFFSVQG